MPRSKRRGYLGSDGGSRQFEQRWKAYDRPVATWLTALMMATTFVVSTYAIYLRLESAKLTATVASLEGKIEPLRKEAEQQRGQAEQLRKDIGDRDLKLEQLRAAAEIPAIATFEIQPASVVAGSTASATLTLAKAAPVNLIAMLKTDRKEIALPSCVSIPAKSTSAKFALSVGNVPQGMQATISATLGERTLDAKVKLVPKPPAPTGTNPRGS